MVDTARKDSDPDVGAKKEAGKDQKRRVFKLDPVRYQIKLLFMGHDVIKRTLSPVGACATSDPDKAKKDPHVDGKAYRCKYTLQRGAADITAFPNLIPNQVRSANNDAPPNDPADEDDKASYPASKKGDGTNPKADTSYRVMITDHHGASHSDLSGGGRNLLGAGADTHSRNDNYKLAEGERKSWMSDVSPALPYRLVVRKFIGATQVDVEDGLSAIVEVKDAMEEFDKPKSDADNTKTKRQLFLEKFFGKYNGSGAKDTHLDDDNAHKKFQGYRDHPRVKSGVIATEVLFTIPYYEKSKIDETPAETEKVKFDQVAAATAYDDGKATCAKFPFTKEVKEHEGEDNEVKVRVADMAFCPWPAGGDNYRFLIRLFDSADKDIREKCDAETNGVPAQYCDDAMKIIPAPRTYVSGRFVIWKKVMIRLVILCNKIAKGTGINWDFIQTSYRKSFMELMPPEDPAGYRELDVDGWLKELEDHFTAQGQATALKVIRHIRNLTADQKAAEYKKWFFPKPDPLPAPTGFLGRIRRAFMSDLTPEERNHFHNTDNYEKVQMKEWMKRPLAQSIVNRVCDIDPKIDSPDRFLHQMDKLEGLFVVFTAEPIPQCPAIGAYLGDRIFWMLNQLKPDKTPNTASTTSTVSHELGHTFYLRHSHTNYGQKCNYRNVQANGTVVDTKVLALLGAQRNQTNLDDHDQHDAYHCLQGYSRPITAVPCAVCRLVLRFYDRVKMAGNGEYRSEILDGLSPMVIGNVKTETDGKPNIDVYPLDGGAHKLPNLAKNGHTFLIALGKETNFTDRGGRVDDGRVNAGVSHGPPAGDDSAKFWKVVSGGPAAFAELASKYMKVTAGATAGDTVIEFNRGGQSVKAKFKIV